MYKQLLLQLVLQMTCAGCWSIYLGLEVRQWTIQAHLSGAALQKSVLDLACSSV